MTGFLYIISIVWIWTCPLEPHALAIWCHREVGCSRSIRRRFTGKWSSIIGCGCALEGQSGSPISPFLFVLPGCCDVSSLALLCDTIQGILPHNRPRNNKIIADRILWNGEGEQMSPHLKSFFFRYCLSDRSWRIKVTIKYEVMV